MTTTKKQSHQATIEQLAALILTQENTDRNRLVISGALGELLGMAVTVALEEGIPNHALTMETLHTAASLLARAPDDHFLRTLYYLFFLVTDVLKDPEVFAKVRNSYVVEILHKTASHKVADPAQATAQ